MPDNKWVLVTGGSRGIGAAVVRQLAHSWNVMFTWQKNQLQAQEIEQSCARLPGKVLGYQCDGTDEKQVATLATKLLAENGAPAGIVHNAGITRDALHIHQSNEDWQNVIDTNLNAIFYWNRQLLPAMFMHGGSIVLMSSVSAIKGNRGQVAYSATKAAMTGIARSLANEVSRFNVRVNCILPGLIETDMVAAMSREERKQLQSQIPLRRLGKPEEIAQSVDFLLSDSATYITGQSLIIDGGLSS